MKILGISCETDAGATIVIDGQIVAVANEERFNRRKFYCGFPSLSIQSVCKKVNLKPDEIDFISVGSLNHISYVGFENPMFHQKVGEKLSKIFFIRKLLNYNLFADLITSIIYLLQTSYRKAIAKKLRQLGFKQKINFVDHHFCHAYAAYYTSGWENCLVVTLDGAGDGYCSKVFIGKNNKLKEVHKITFYNSPGYYYSHITKICGFKCGREGKVTGLAAFGNPEITKNIFESRIEYNSKKTTFINKGYYLNTEKDYLSHALKGLNKKDIAAGMQQHLEEIVVRYINDLVKKFNKSSPIKIALCGGVFANVKLNQRIAESSFVKETYIYPHMGDGGLSAGAAFFTFVKKGFKLIPYKLENLYLGIDYSEKDILEILNCANVSFLKASNPAFTMAKAIKEGKVVAYFNGAMEYGPRALGHRSIFVSAKNPEINDELNHKLQRSEFMPFAPIILKEKESYYFLSLDSKHNCSKFMTVTTEVTKKALIDIPAAVHVDGTARFQSITKEQNPVIHEMLTIYHAMTGVPAVINTSFNMHEEPIVESPRDAIECFHKGYLDMLVIGNYILEKPQNRTESIHKEKENLAVR